MPSACNHRRTRACLCTMAFSGHQWPSVATSGHQW
jgi:hypothetical protein